MEYLAFGPNHRQVDSIGLGVFDGFHQGHKSIADKCKWLLTFNPHPDVFLKKKQALKMLTSVPEMRYYVPNLLVFKFNKQLATTPPEDFLNIIKEKFNPNTIVVGYDYQFGYKHQGNIHLLIDWAAKNDVLAVEVPPYKIEDVPVKSSQIRDLILNNKLDDAVRLLGHPYLILGTVVKGEGRGHKIGFPTANIIPSEEKLVPVSGVYAGYVELGARRHSAIIYIGSKPTFEGKQVVVEVHILNFSQDIYNRHLKVHLEHKIRDDQKFESVESLVTQIGADIDFAFPDKS